ncbi:MAG: hypothetical protein GY791_04610 [Alphaproteobacteria bacterium]|nr:hypothetical protein [Alphaproteobacteria bacterium]
MKSTLPLGFGVVLTVLVVACAIQRTDLSVVREGATRAQVERVLGKPIKSVGIENGRIDIYEYNRGYEPKPRRTADLGKSAAGLDIVAYHHPCRSFDQL